MLAASTHATSTSRASTTLTARLVLVKWWTASTTRCSVVGGTQSPTRVAPCMSSRSSTTPVATTIGTDRTSVGRGVGESTSATSQATTNSGNSPCVSGPTNASSTSNTHQRSEARAATPRSRMRMTAYQPIVTSSVSSEYARASAAFTPKRYTSASSGGATTASRRPPTRRPRTATSGRVARANSSDGRRSHHAAALTFTQGTRRR